MDAGRTPKSIFNNEPEGNKLRDRYKNCWWNFMQSDLKKYEVFYRKKRSTDREDCKKSIDETKVFIRL